jgi:hypothetical protein
MTFAFELFLACAGALRLRLQLLLPLPLHACDCTCSWQLPLATTASLTPAQVFADCLLALSVLSGLLLYNRTFIVAANREHLTTTILVCMFSALALLLGMVADEARPGSLRRGPCSLATAACLPFNCITTVAVLL